MSLKDLPNMTAQQVFETKLSTTHFNDSRKLSSLESKQDFQQACSFLLLTQSPIAERNSKVRNSPLGRTTSSSVRF